MVGSSHTVGRGGGSRARGGLPRLRHGLLALPTATLLLAAFLLIPAAGAKQAGRKVLTVATNGSVDSLSPFLAQRVLPTAIHRLVYDFLTNYDPKDDHAVPALATSWTASPDKLTWTYAIRSGMKWSDGVPVTARDIAWTYNLMMTNKDAATANGNFVANFKSVTAPDDSTLVVVLGKPQATMLALDIPVVPQHAWESHVSEIGKFNNDTSFPVVGDGPFVLSDYKKDQYVQLDANPSYWRGRSRFDRLVFKYYANKDAEGQALKKGEGYVPPIFSAYTWTPSASETVGSDPVKANQLLDQAGYRKGSDGLRTTPDGKPFTLRLYGETQRAEDAQNATFVKEWLDSVGINVTTSIMDQATMGDDETAGNYDLAFDSWVVNPDPDFVLSLQTCAGRPATPGGSFSGDDFVCDPAYDQLHAALISEYDAAARARIVKKMEAQLYADRYVNVLYYPNTLEAYRSDVISSMEMQPQPNGIYDGQDGYWSWWSAAPAPAPPSRAGAAPFVAGAVAACSLAAAVVLLVLRRRPTAEGRE